MKPRSRSSQLVEVRVGRVSVDGGGLQGLSRDKVSAILCEAIAARLPPGSGERPRWIEDAAAAFADRIAGLAETHRASPASGPPTKGSAQP